MSLVLARIDDRLIHGQVTIGWCSYLNPDRIVLVSDEIAKNEWERELYQSSVPFNIAVSIYSAKEAAEAIISNVFAPERIILLAESPAVFVQLVKSGAHFIQINIGGMHSAENKHQILPYIYLDDDDLQNLLFLAEHDIELLCQDLPQGKKANLLKLIK